LYIKNSADGDHVTIACRNIKSVVTKNSTVILHLSGETLDLKVEGGQSYEVGGDQVYINDSQFDTINIEAKSVGIHIYNSEVNAINGSLSNETVLNVKNTKIRKINLEISEDSRYQVIR
jgi:hypothetical protein